MSLTWISDYELGCFFDKAKRYKEVKWGRNLPNRDPEIDEVFVRYFRTDDGRMLHEVRREGYSPQTHKNLQDALRSISVMMIK